MCTFDMHAHEDAFDLLLKMVGYTKTLQLIDDSEPSWQIFLLLEQQLPHSVLQGRLERVLLVRLHQLKTT